MNNDTKFQIPKTLTLEQLMAHLQIERTYAYNLMRRKDFPSYKVGREWRVDMKDLLEWKEVQKENKCAYPLFESDSALNSAFFKKKRPLDN